jgi:hypothetical protein
MPGTMICTGFDMVTTIADSENPVCVKQRELQEKAAKELQEQAAKEGPPSTDEPNKDDDESEAVKELQEQSAKDVPLSTDESNKDDDESEAVKVEGGQTGEHQ